VKLTREINFSVLVLSLFLYTSADAQLCQGSLGDPVVNITFGSGSNYGSQLDTSITNYIYDPRGCPNDGFYVIANSIGNCYSGSWHALLEDHTVGDTSGYMMVVNASNNPGDFYVQQVDGLCAGVSYQFASWIINIQKPAICGNNQISPKVTFTIETTSGTVLLKSNTGSIPSENGGVWKQFGAFFKMPAQTSSVIIRLTNDGPGGCGNDLAIDDITFRPCGSLISTGINGSSTTFDYCVGQTPAIVLSANELSSETPSYQWQSSNDKGVTWKDIAGATSVIYTPPTITTTGTFLYRLSVAQGSDISTTSCRFVSNPLTVNVYSNPVPLITGNSPVCEGETLTISATNGDQYTWTGPFNYSGTGSSVSIDKADAKNSGKYYVTVTSDKRCTAKDSITIFVAEKPVISVSNPSGFCEGDSGKLQASGANVKSWKWTPSTGLSSDTISNPTAFPTNSTTYIVTAFNGTCTNEDSVKVTVFNKPVANAGNDKILYVGSPILLNGSAAGTDVSLQWSPVTFLDKPTIATPLSSASADITYTLTVTSNKGCGVSSDDVFVKVYEKKIPNAFSPNNDGINDSWNIPFLELYPDAVISVFNRYGQVVFYSKGTYQPWIGTFKGKPLPVGTYYYTILSSNFNLKFSGWVLIVR
jgi:gliding motility-associated-like protein